MSDLVRNKSQAGQDAPLYRAQLRMWVRVQAIVLGTGLMVMEIWALISTRNSPELDTFTRVLGTMMALFLGYCALYCWRAHVTFWEDHIEYWRALGPARAAPYSQVVEISESIRDMKIRLADGSSIKVHRQEGDLDLIRTIVESRMTKKP